jgi:hypothetical protein
VIRIFKLFFFLIYLYFNKLLAQHRSLRGSLTSTIKKSLFQVFGERDLPRINANAKHAEVMEWKKCTQVRECYEKLFRLYSDGVTYMDKILRNTWNERVPKVHVAYAIGVCEVFLNPKIEQIQISEGIMKNIIEKNLVSSRKFL